MSQFKGEKVMLPQSFLYLTNRKYATSLDSLDSLMEEVASYFSHSSTQRKVVIVGSEDSGLIEEMFKEPVVEILRKFNPIVDDTSVDNVLSFKSLEEVDNTDYIENDEKVFLVFTTTQDLYTLYLKYIDRLLSTTEGYDSARLKDYALKVLRRDIDFSTDDYVTDEYIEGLVDAIFDNNNRYESAVKGSKCWSYDLLFYMNDHMPEDATSLPLIREKFAIHSTKIVQEMLQCIQSHTLCIAPIMGIVDYLVSIGDTTYDKNALIKGVWKNDNMQEALYLLNGFYSYVATVDGLVDKLEAHPSFEYYESYRELSKTLPILVAFSERGFDSLNTEDVRSQWSEIEFLYKRRNRIPYLMWTVTPLT